jgi:hypothetical protein
MASPLEVPELSGDWKRERRRTRARDSCTAVRVAKCSSAFEANQVAVRSTVGILHSVFRLVVARNGPGYPVEALVVTAHPKFEERSFAATPDNLFKPGPLQQRCAGHRHTSFFLTEWRTGQMVTVSREGHRRRAAFSDQDKSRLVEFLKSLPRAKDDGFP